MRTITEETQGTMSEEERQEKIKTLVDLMKCRVAALRDGRSHKELRALERQFESLCIELFGETL